MTNIQSRMLYFFLFLFHSVSSLASVFIKPNLKEDLFLCNAGIMHSISDVGGRDAIQVQYEDMSVENTHPAHNRAATFESNPSLASYQILFDENTIWFRNITQLGFILSTEKTGAIYFVDFCYLGPLEDLKNNGIKKSDFSEGVYKLNTSVTSAKKDGDLLRTNVEFSCDLRQQGINRKPRSSNEFAPSGEQENDSSSRSELSAIISNGIFTEIYLNSQTATAPRFCRIRLSFTESSGQARKNSLLNSEITTFLDIQKLDSF